MGMRNVNEEVGGKKRHSGVSETFILFGVRMAKNSGGFTRATWASNDDKLECALPSNNTRMVL